MLNHFDALWSWPSVIFFFVFPVSCSAVDVDKTNIRFLSHKSGIASTQIVVGTVAGILVLLGVAAMVVWMVVYKLKKKGYEKVPLLADE